MENVINIYEESFFENILNEAIYTNPYIKQIEAHFKEILDKCLVKDAKYKMGYAPIDIKNKTLNQNLDKIEKLFNKAFNINCHIKLDKDNPDKVIYGERIWITQDEMEEAMKTVDGGVKEGKSGLYFVNIKKCDIDIQEAFLKFILKNHLNERHLVAVLLHEIGHKLFLKLNIKLDKKHAIIELVNTGTSFSVMLAGAALASLNVLFIIPAILALVACPVISTINSFKNYSATEGNCDNNAVIYGYGKEIYEVMAMFELMDSKYLATKRNFIRNLFNADYQRRNLIYLNIQKEINNPENSEKDREKLKEILKNIDKFNQEHTKK